MSFTNILGALATAGGAGLSEYSRYKERETERKTADEQRKEDLELRRTIAMAEDAYHRSQDANEKRRIESWITNAEGELRLKGKEVETQRMLGLMPYERPTANETVGNRSNERVAGIHAGATVEAARLGAESRLDVGAMHWSQNTNDPRVRQILQAGDQAYQHYKSGIPRDKYTIDPQKIEAEAQDYKRRAQQQATQMYGGEWDPVTDAPILPRQNSVNQSSFSIRGPSYRRPTYPVGSSGGAPNVAPPSSGRRRGFQPIQP